MHTGKGTAHFLRLFASFLTISRYLCITQRHVILKQKRNHIIIPEGLQGSLLLHACCAPCSSAIVEWLTAHGIRPTIFYFNPNIYPLREYETRKEESQRHAESLGLSWIDGDYDHAAWREAVKGMESESERGLRCEQCFAMRLTASARMAERLGLRFFATTLASSRWKNLEQVNAAGLLAQQAVPGTTFWAQNWRKDGLQERRNELLREYQFYNQLYCGCEFSLASSIAMQRQKEAEEGQQ